MKSIALMFHVKQNEMFYTQKAAVQQVQLLFAIKQRSVCQKGKSALMSNLKIHFVLM